MINSQNILDIAVGLSIFGLVLSLWIGGVVIWYSRRSSQARRLHQRLERSESGVIADASPRVLHLWHEGGEATTVVPGEKTRLSIAGRLARMHRQAGWQIPVRSVMLIVVAAMLLLGAVTIAATGNPLLALLMAAVVLMVFRMLVKRRISRRAALFETQFLDALELAARSLRAGHPVLGAFRLISEEMSPPVSSVFADLCQQHGLGMGLQECLQREAAVSTSEELKLFATSLGIQLRTGGNLADMMDRLSAVIRDRMRLSRRARILTSQTQFSKRILVALPITLFILLNLIRPEYMKPLYQTAAGNMVLIVAVVMLVLGVWMMNRMAVLHY